MQKLLRSRKGFTLIELIVVIVIIAILIAALTPAILGVIRRANVAADEADARTVMMAGSVAGLMQVPPGLPPVGSGAAPGAHTILGQFTGTNNVRSGTYYVQFEGAVAIACTFAIDNRSATPQSVGLPPNTHLAPPLPPNTLTVVVP